MHKHRKSQRWTGWKRGLMVTVFVLVGLIVVVAVVGSPVAKSVSNRKLADLPDYVGRVDTVRLWLWRGGGEIGNFVLHERGREADLPLVRVKRASLAITYRTLLRGKLGGRAAVENAEFNIIKSQPTPKKDAPEEKQEKKEKAEMKKAEVKRWQETLEEAFPMEITSLELTDAKVRFIDRTVQPEVDIALADMHLLATDLGNRPDPQDGPMPAKLELRGTTTGNGRLKVSVQADPLAEQPRFMTNLELRDMALPAFNSFLLAYANADVSRGTFELYTEVNAADGAYEGYLKPFFKDLDFKTASDKDKNAAQLLMKKAVTAVTTALKNDEKDQVATKVPIVGNFSDRKVGVWTAIQNLLRNAFVQALRGGLEGQPPPKSGSSSDPS